MRDKRKIREVVLNILSNDSKARNSDRYLYVEVVKQLNPNLAFVPLAIALQDASIPNMETVRRSRQWCQAHYRSLRPTVNVAAARELQEESYREVFANGRGLDKTS